MRQLCIGALRRIPIVQFLASLEEGKEECFCNNKRDVNRTEKSYLFHLIFLCKEKIPMCETIEKAW